MLIKLHLQVDQQAVEYSEKYHPLDPYLVTDHFGRPLLAQALATVGQLEATCAALQYNMYLLNEMIEREREMEKMAQEWRNNPHSGRALLMPGEYGARENIENDPFFRSDRIPLMKPPADTSWIKTTRKEEAEDEPAGEEQG